MNTSVWSKYDSVIDDFLTDVTKWLDERVPVNGSDVAELADTKAVWREIHGNPRIMVQYDKLYNHVCGHTNGFIVKKGTNKADNTMLWVVIPVLTAMDNFYQIGGIRQRKELLNAIKKYKITRAKNPLTRAIISLKKPERFLLGKQR